MKIAQWTSKTARYVAVAEQQIPNGVRFDVPRQNQGQTVEVAYGGFGRAEHGHGDPFQRVIDKSDGSTEFFCWQEAKETL